MLLTKSHLENCAPTLWCLSGSLYALQLRGHENLSTQLFIWVESFHRLPFICTEYHRFSCIDDSQHSKLYATKTSRQTASEDTSHRIKRPLELWVARITLTCLQEKILFLMSFDNAFGLHCGVQASNIAWPGNDIKPRQLCKGRNTSMVCFSALSWCGFSGW